MTDVRLNMGVRPSYTPEASSLPRSAASPQLSSALGLVAASVAALGLVCVGYQATAQGPAQGSMALYQSVAVRPAVNVAPGAVRYGYTAPVSMQSRVPYTAQPRAQGSAPGVFMASNAAGPAAEAPAHTQSMALVAMAGLGMLMAAAGRLLMGKRTDIFANLDLEQAPLRSIAMATVSSERPSATGVNYDVRFVAENPELVLAHLRSRKGDMEAMEAAVARIGVLNQEKSSLQTKRDSALSQRKKLSGQIGMLMKGDGQSKDAEKKKNALMMIGKLKKTVQESADVAAAADEQLAAGVTEAEQLFAAMPNLLADNVPEGKGEEENELVSEWGTELRLIGEDYKWHDDLAQGLGGWEAEGAAKISGARFSVLASDVARLERALTQFFLNTHVENGYREMSVPLIVGRTALEGTGQLPKFEEDLFKVSHSVNGEDAFLIPTAEVPLTNLYADMILDKSKLPISMVALTPCFRAEAGGYGRDTKGLIRQHQFPKVELVKITAAEDSEEQHELLTEHAEGILKALKLPYRKMRLCSGDIGFSARMCYDLEVWLPGQQMYREISSCSNCGDFQARRMKLRYRPPAEAPKEGEKKAKKPANIFAHTINGSGIAVGRALLAVLENYQQPDGSVKVPEVLIPYMGKEVMEVAN